MQLDDDVFLERFARRDLGPEHFDHRGHLRLAWLHLARFSQEEACLRVCEGIRALAAEFGAPEKFNYTLTEALMRIMASRMEAGDVEDFDAFLRANPDLLDDCIGLLAQYYSDELLHSAAAKQTWQTPDRLSLPG